jgi:hypothetical protein
MAPILLYLFAVQVWYEAGGLTVTAAKDMGGNYNVTVEAAEPRELVLHWGVNDWEAPPAEATPNGSHKVSSCIRRMKCASRLGSTAAMVVDETEVASPNARTTSLLGCPVLSSCRQLHQTNRLATAEGSTNNDASTSQRLPSSDIAVVAS